MDHLLVAGFDIGQKRAPRAALRERARRPEKKIKGVQLARNRSESPQRSLGARAWWLHA
jgi:hypothetical protein